MSRTAIGWIRLPTQRGVTITGIFRYRYRGTPSSRISRGVRYSSKAISIALVIAILWAGAALWIDGPESRLLAGILAGAVVTAFGALYFFRVPAPIPRLPPVTIKTLS